MTMVAGGATELLMPRIFYADPEVTVGWKARWHVSVLAPVMTLTSATLLNDLALKNLFKSHRPGCDESNNKLAGCESYGSPSTHAFASFSALGHGAAVFVFDTFKWSGGRFNGGAFAGHLAGPLVLAGITGVGRSVGDYESFGQVLVGGTIGLGVGFLSGLTYSLMQRPECGYTGSLICW
ncbi:MAG: phosphatase PAP2 family protein [Myxococcales bacterium]|nr:phosphatase PAP2 family protein [Myxococcales bacterium]